MDPDATSESGRGCPLVVHYWADLQLVHRLRCYGNITRTRNVSEYMLVPGLCLVIIATRQDFNKNVLKSNSMWRILKFDFTSDAT